MSAERSGKDARASRVSVAIVSPFVDKRHGTERCLAEQVERLAEDFDIHLFSQRVEDTDLSRITWHHVPQIPGPHLCQYLFWFAANHYCRWRERRRAGRPFALVYSPGINCWDAEVIQVHIVFAEFLRYVGPSLRLGRNPMRIWPRLLHRRLYYRLLIWLEQQVYRRPNLALAGISRKTSEDLQRCFGLNEKPPVVYHGIDAGRFKPSARAALREQARRELKLGPKEFIVLLVGNDWKKKGLDCLLEALELVKDENVRLLIVGHDDPRPFTNRQRALRGRVVISPVRPDVEYYYAAADLLAAPSLEDAFSLPPLEAMGMGLPVIVSRKAGVSEIVEHGYDALILEEPTDPEELAGLLAQVRDDPSLRERLSRNGAETGRTFTWEANAQQMKRVFGQCLASKRERSTP